MKASKLYLLISLVLMAVIGNAQINTAVTNNLPASKIPSGYTTPDIDTLTGNVQSFRMTIDLDASTYDNVTILTAFNAIMPAVKTELDSNYVEDVWGWDPDIDRDVVYKVNNIQRTWDNIDGTEPLAIYGVAEDVFRIGLIIKYVVR